MVSKLVLSLGSGAALLLLGSLTPPPPAAARSGQAHSLVDAPIVAAEPSIAVVPVEPPSPPPPPAPPTPEEALENGVLIVVSIASQKLFVFKGGELWDSSKVSTGKRGKETPAGIFPILQKKVHHRSTLYDDAPMPYMQRLTWDGVALHAGHVPGYPASHGCIRLPRSFAKRLYGITGFSSTAVVVTDERLSSAREAEGLV